MSDSNRNHGLLGVKHGATGVTVVPCTSSFTIELAVNLDVFVALLYSVVLRKT